MAPSIVNGIPTSNDLPAHYRMATSFYDSLSKGNLFPGWSARSTNGYGDVSLRFYPPLVYYVLSGCRALTGNWYYASLLFFVLASICGGLGVYCWAKTLLPANQAMWAGIFFLIIPYHVNLIYQAFLLAEYTGCSILPFAFAFTERVCRRGRPRDVLGLSVSYALLILTHIPLTVIGSISLLAYALMRANGSNRFRTILRLGLAVMLALAASAFYWVTMIAEFHWMAGNTIDPAVWFDYRYNFLFWRTVEGSTIWWADMLAVAMLIMFLPGFLLKRSWQGKVSSNGLKAVGFLTVFAFMMALPISEPLWRLCRPLQRIEFPWRWLSVASMSGSVLLASTTEYWRGLVKTRARPLAFLAAACIVVPFALTISQTIRGATYIPRPRFEEMASQAAETNSLPFFLPKWVSNGARQMPQEVEAGNRTVTIDSWEAERRIFHVSSGEKTEARVRTFYYPYWTAMAGAEPLPIGWDTDGAILISLPRDAVSVTLEFREPTRKLLSILTSVIVSVFIGCVLILLPFQRNRAKGVSDSNEIGASITSVGNPNASA